MDLLIPPPPFPEGLLVFLEREERQFLDISFVAPCKWSLSICQPLSLHSSTHRVLPPPLPPAKGIAVSSFAEETGVLGSPQVMGTCAQV